MPTRTAQPKTKERTKRPPIADVIEGTISNPDEQTQAMMKPSANQLMALKDYAADEIEIIKNTVAKGVSNFELAWFLTVAKQLGLSPLAREIYAVRRWDKRLNGGNGGYVMTIQTGIDGFRKIADRTGRYAPSDRKPEVIYDAQDRLHSITFWVKKFVAIDRSWHEYSATVVWSEFVPYQWEDGQKKVPAMWKDKPYNQLEKCAEAKALRRGFPNEFGGIYVTEEMHRADSEERSDIAEQTGASHVVTRETLQADKRKRERGTLEVGKEQNRGHGNEGFEDGPKPGTKAVPPDEMKKQDKEAEKQAKLETIDTTVMKVDSKMRALTPKQVAENKQAHAEKKDPPHSPQPYFVINCAGDITVWVWDRHLFPAVVLCKPKQHVIWKIERRTNDAGKEFLGLQEIVEQDGVPFTRDPETRDWIRASQLRTEAPSSADKGETAPEAASDELF